MADDVYKEDYRMFQKDMLSLGKTAPMQNFITSARAIIGSIGAIVEPSLTASAAFAASGQTAAAAVAMTTAATGKAAIAAKAVDVAKKAIKAAPITTSLEKCL